jgi:hypothetical protein
VGGGRSVGEAVPAWFDFCRKANIQKGEHQKSCKLCGQSKQDPEKAISDGPDAILFGHEEHFVARAKTTLLDSQHHLI